MDQELKWIRAIVRKGSKDAADLLVRAYYDEIYAYVYHQVSSRESALDLTQDIFIAVLRSLPSFDAQKAGFRTWLYRIATNKVIDARRKVRPLMVEIEKDTACEEDFSTAVMDRELIGRIEDYVRAFDPQLQMIFRLRIYANYRFPDIAATLSQPEAKIKAQYYRMMKRVREEFDSHV